MFGPHMSRDNAMTMAFAYQEASELGAGSGELGNDHLLLGMLCNARAPIFSTLTAQGLTLQAARAAAREYRAGDDATKADEAAAAAAREQQRTEERERVDEDRAALAAIGIDLDKVKAAVQARFGDDITEGWTMRPTDRRRERDAREHGRRDHHEHGRGRRGHHPRGADADGPLERGPHGRGPRADERFFERPDFAAFAGPGFAGPGFAGPGGFDPASGFPGDPDEGPRRGGGRGRRGPRRGPFGRPRFSADSKAAFAYAVEYARADGEELTAEHVLRGILKVGDDASRAVISSATSPEALLAAIRNEESTDSPDQSPEQE
ncbi:hypothetical protein GCM10027169_07740 [Gordonia jinhuaensis]|uniref:Clp amino terminal domain-containing protein, pathogenicity island component n=1 Tax=Gordonia jinhuaensis TaxID=1517702 RepID=A0A916SWU5_9ACTN|nr:Clp protease N-terminal domain-containing protein [Gordonia jinhuaensis]GGB21692.1 hypothetical protein GCM10011489_07340 [Gordonia jinhuaensis]